jgi:hypothetical protein
MDSGSALCLAGMTKLKGQWQTLPFVIIKTNSTAPSLWGRVAEPATQSAKAADHEQPPARLGTTFGVSIKSQQPHPASHRHCGQAQRDPQSMPLAVVGQIGCRKCSAICAQRTTVSAMDFGSALRLARMAKLGYFNQICPQHSNLI